MGAQLTIVLSSIQCSNFVFSFVYMNHNAQSVIYLLECHLGGHKATLR